MLRIVGIQKSADPGGEFVLLQNQGSLRVALRGHVLLGESRLSCGHGPLHLFADDVTIPAGKYVLLQTGGGEARWAQTRDGALVFHTFIGQAEPLWTEEVGALHLLAPSHTYSDRKECAAVA